MGTRRQFGREFKREAVRLVKDRGVSVAQAVTHSRSKTSFMTEQNVVSRGLLMLFSIASKSKAPAAHSATRADAKVAAKVAGATVKRDCVLPSSGAGQRTNAKVAGKVAPETKKHDDNLIEPNAKETATAPRDEQLGTTVARSFAASNAESLAGAPFPSELSSKRNGPGAPRHAKGIHGRIHEAA